MYVCMIYIIYIHILCHAHAAMHRVQLHEHGLFTSAEILGARANFTRLHVTTREQGLGNSEAQELAEQMDEKSKEPEMTGTGTDDVETG